MEYEISRIGERIWEAYLDAAIFSYQRDFFSGDDIKSIRLRHWMTFVDVFDRHEFSDRRDFHGAKTIGISNWQRKWREGGVKGRIHVDHPNLCAELALLRVHELNYTRNAHNCNNYL